MKISETTSGTQSVTASHTLATVTTPGLYWLVFDLNGMVNGDTLEVWTESKALTGSTARQSSPKHIFANAQAIDTVILGPWPVVHSTAFMINKVGGADVSVDWSVRRGVGNLEEWLGTAPNSLTSGRVEALVGAMSSGVITSTVIAANAIGASELATDAVTEISDAVWASATRTLTSLAASVLSTDAAEEIATALLDLADGVETGWTVRKALRIMAAALAGELTGAATTTITIRDIADAKTRITATVDSNGNRSALTLDAT